MMFIVYHYASGCKITKRFSYYIFSYVEVKRKTLRFLLFSKTVQVCTLGYYTFPLVSCRTEACDKHEHEFATHGQASNKFSSSNRQHEGEQISQTKILSGRRELCTTLQLL
uniref:Uncharacterized protein n=1 Tax=Cacopsylla melanoneura TaxID=428564 RepID=A0A8D8RRR7_9HEMI